MNRWIEYFTRRPLLTNLLLIGILGAAVLFWFRIGKEEMPEFETDWLRATIRYPGASAEDVEALITRIIEEQLKGLSGIDEVRSTSAFGNSQFRITLAPNAGDTRETIQQIKDAFDRAELPLEAEEPVYSRFTSYEKAILDVGLYHKNAHLLDVRSRAELQKYVLAFENQLLSLPEISGIERSAYVKPELQIVIDPDALRKYDISLAEVREQILSHHIRVPAGTMEDEDESEITVVSELDDIPALENLVIRGGFEGKRVLLGQVASVRRDFARVTSISKVQGHEGIVLNVKKSADTDILSAQKAVVGFIQRFKANHSDSPVGIVLMDDESYDVRNRLNLIGSNGLLGFVLIVLILFAFLDFRSGIWVAAGIPFSLAFTLLAAYLIGYTVNNMTLAAIIIVLGIVVDDAIIIAENVSRLRSQGATPLRAVVDGTAEMFSPILASILTTCAAFVPLYFFSGRFGMFVKVIPGLVFLMLAASLLESLVILPGHLKGGSRDEHREAAVSGHWMFHVEEAYAGVLAGFLRFRWFVVIVFGGLLALSFYLFQAEMRFVMFPREETSQISVRAMGPEGTNRIEMAKKIRPLEDIFLKAEGMVTAVRSSVAQSRRGGPVRDNEASLRVELVPLSERGVPLSKLLEKWEKAASELEGFEEIRFIRSRFGSDAGSPIHIEVQENDDVLRRDTVNALSEQMKRDPALANVEIERPVTRREFRAVLKQDDIMRLGVNAKSLASALRAYVEGEVLYRFIRGDEEVDVRLTSEDENKTNIDDVLSLRASNSQGYLVPFSSLITVQEGRKPANIQRVNFKRTTEIYADLKEGTEKTPLEIADRIEREVFPDIARRFPSSVLKFRGEVEDSRESQGDFGFSLLLVLGLIYFLLVVLYNSLSVPLLIGAVIPFGLVGVIMAFYAHGMSQYGFFAVVGTLGMIGVVVNDSIVMVAKLESSIDRTEFGESMMRHIAEVSATRLRPVVVTTLTTVAGLLPTAYGIMGYDSMLAEMMLAMAWGLLFATVITLILIPCLYTFFMAFRRRGWA